MIGEFYSCLSCAYACDQFFFFCFFCFLFGRALGTDGEKSACTALLNGCLANENFYIYISTAIPRK